VAQTIMANGGGRRSRGMDVLLRNPGLQKRRAGWPQRCRVVARHATGTVVARAQFLCLVLVHKHVYGAVSDQGLCEVILECATLLSQSRNRKAHHVMNGWRL
jgi:hypothetical protein